MSRVTHLWSELRRDPIRTLFGVVMLAIAVPRLMFSLYVRDFGADGGYYSNIARNVRDGNGLTTDLSIFHQGFPHFPYPTPVYPVWPFVYGMVAKVAPLEVVGVWLPTVAWVAIVAFAFVLGRRLAPRISLAPLPIPQTLHGGHVFALVTALTSELAKATSAPYTEGVAFILLFGCMLRGPVLWRRLGAVAGIEFGVWLILLLLVRSQFIVVGIAAAMCVPFAALRRPRAAVAFALGAGLVAFGSWHAYEAWVGTFLPSPTLQTYIRFDLARAPSALSEVPVMAPDEGLAARLSAIASGFQGAFWIFDNSASYYHLHGAFIHAVVLALPLLALRARHWRLLLRFLRSPAGPGAAFVTASAIGLMLSLHTVHKVYGASWVFGSRHGIPSLFIVATCMLLLLRSRGAWRWVGVLLLLLGTYTGWRQLVLLANDRMVDSWKAPSLLGYRSEIRGFMLGELERRGELTMGVERPEAQRLAWRTPGVGFHWLTETTTVEDATVLVRDLGVDYIVDFDEIRYLKLAADPEFAQRFTEYTTFTEGGAGDGDDASTATVGKARVTHVYAPRCEYFPLSPTCIRGAPMPQPTTPPP